MNREEVNQMVNAAKEKRQTDIDKAEALIRHTLSAYFSLHPDDAGYEEYNNMVTIQTLLNEPDWYQKHDSVWRIFLELQHSLAVKYMIQHADPQSPFYQINWKKLQRMIDPDVNGDIETRYLAKYLDSDKINYDGNMIICDPFLLMNETLQKACPSMQVRDTLTEKQTYFADKTEFGSSTHFIKITTGHIGVVLMKDVHDAGVGNSLLRMNTWDYVYVKQFHGTVQFLVTKEEPHCLHIIGDGNKPFQISQFTPQ